MRRFELSAVLLSAVAASAFAGDDWPSLLDNGKSRQALAPASLSNATQRVHSTLTAQTPQAEFAAPAKTTSSFTVKFTVDLKKFDGEKNILEIPNVLSVRLRQHDPRDRNRQNYPAFKMPDGSVPVLEANVVLHSVEHPDWKNMTIGIPLAMLKKPEGEHEVVLNFSGVRWTMYVDGELLDNDFPFGYPQWAEKNTWKLDAGVREEGGDLSSRASSPRRNRRRRPARRPASSTGLPPGHNNWVGDVATFFHQGAITCSICTTAAITRASSAAARTTSNTSPPTDFKTWTEHEAATPLEEQWECIGTGAPFVFNGQALHQLRPAHHARLSAGEDDAARAVGIPEEERTHGRVQAGHDARACPRARPTPSARTASRTSRSRTSCSIPARTRASIPTPAANCECWPTPAPTASGNRNRWTAAGAASVRASRPAATARSSSAGASSITSSAASPGSGRSRPTRRTRPIEDVVRKGLDFYDGSNVPSITEIAGGRFLMAAWIPIRGWGGNLADPRADPISRRPDRLEVDEGNHARNRAAQDAGGAGSPKRRRSRRTANRSC